MQEMQATLKSRDIALPTKVYIVKAMVLPVVMYSCESWSIKKAEHQRIDVFELQYWIRLLRVPLDSKEMKPVNPKGNQPWMFTGRTDTDGEALIFWPPDAKSWLIGKDLEAGKDWGQEEKGTTENKMVGWHHWLSRNEFQQTPGDSERQGSLVYCSSCGHKVRLNLATKQQQRGFWHTIKNNTELFTGQWQKSISM